MLGLCRYSILHPTRVCIIAAAVTLAIAPGGLRLEIRTDGHALVPADAPEITIDREIRDRFGVEDPVVVLIDSDHARGVYNLHTLGLVRDLTVAFREIDGVKTWNVVSLSTEKTDRVRTGTLHFRTLLEPFPETDKDLDRIRDDVRAIQLYTGTLVSFDEGATAVFVGIPDDADRIGLYRTITEIVAKHDAADDRIHVIGAPVAEALLGTHILEDLGVPGAVLGHSLEHAGASARRDSRTSGSGGWAGAGRALVQRVGMVPLALAIIAVVFWIAFRGVAAVMLPLMEVGACLVLVFGVMGWLRVPFYLTMAVMPVILTVVGIADEVHIFHRYRRERRTARAEAHGFESLGFEPVRRTMEQMWAPVTKTSITTALAFLSFALSPIEPVRMFGVFTALGIIICMVWSLTVIPALLVLLDRWGTTRRWRSGLGGERPVAGAPGSVAPEVEAPRLERLTRAVLARPVTVLLLALLVVVATPYGLRRLVVQDSWIDGFAPTSEFHRATRMFNDRFLGVHTLHIHLDGGHFVREGPVVARDVDHHQLKVPAGLVDNPRMLLDSYIRVHPCGDTGGTKRRRDEGEERHRGTKARRHGGEERHERTDNRQSPIVNRQSAIVNSVRRLPDWTSTIQSVVLEDDGWTISTAQRSGSLKIAMRRWSGNPACYEITPRWFKQPRFLERVRRFETFLRRQSGGMVGGALGPAAYVATANFMQSGRRDGSRSIPDDGSRLSRVWHNFERIRGLERLRQVVDPQFASGLISIFLKNANYVETAALMKRIRAYEREHLQPHGITLNFSGDVAVSQALIDGIVTTQVRSLLISLIGIWLVTSALNRSLLWGLFCVLPSALAVLVNFALMGWFNVPVGVATSMFAGITLGIGVDYAIHLLERVRQWVPRSGWPTSFRGGGRDDPHPSVAPSRIIYPPPSEKVGHPSVPRLKTAAALIEAVASTGPAIGIDALAVGLGFGVMLLSQVPANVRLGGLLASSIVTCLAATILLLPAVVLFFPPKWMQTLSASHREAVKMGTPPVGTPLEQRI
ncbi:MAG: MMPL family transporter [Phycisphaerae bacterium]